MNQNQGGLPFGQVNLSNRLRRLWNQLAMWRREYLISLASNSVNLKLIEDRLYNVTTDFGNVLESFFGVEAANQMEYYFTVQASILNEIANAIKTGNNEAANAATQRLYENVDDMAAYLAGFNPYWNQVNLKSLFYDYYRQTILETVNILSGNMEDAIKLYENLEDYVLKIADYLTEGFIRYFT
jgi:hypothetical protein